MPDSDLVHASAPGELREEDMQKRRQMRPSKILIHNFVLVLEGPNPIEQENLDRLFEAGCDDALFGERDGVYYADFDREAASFSEALVSAMAAVQGAVPGLKVVRVEPETLVTASEIAARTNRSRENIRQYFEGARGPGNFPKPVAWLSDRTRVWEWSDVSRWFSTKLHEDVGAGEAKVVAQINALLTLLQPGREKHRSARAVDLKRVIAKTLKLRGEVRASASDWRELLKYLKPIEEELAHQPSTK